MANRQHFSPSVAKLVVGLIKRHQRGVPLRAIGHLCQEATKEQNHRLLASPVGQTHGALVGDIPKGKVGGYLAEGQT
jgi:hypothetical protein